MKKFIKRILFFAAPLVVPFLALFLYFSISSKSKIENYKFSPTINKLIIGDSHTRLAINDKFLSNAINISQNSEGQIYSYYKLKALLANNPQIDTIFLGAGYHTFAGYYDDHVLLPDISSRYFFILPSKVQVDLFKNTKSPGLLIVKSLLVGASNVFSSGTKLSFLGAYENYTTKVSTSDSSIADRIQKAFFVKKELSTFSKSNLFYFQEIIKLCKERKIYVCVINTPTHKKYAQQVPVEFRNKYYSMIKASEADLFEFDGLELGDKDFLPDGDHVTENGASLTSKYLQKFISEKTTK